MKEISNPVQANAKTTAMTVFLARHKTSIRLSKSISLLLGDARGYSGK
jgi:hypothetical protein